MVEQEDLNKAVNKTTDAHLEAETALYQSKEIFKVDSTFKAGGAQPAKKSEAPSSWGAIAVDVIGASGTLERAINL